MSEVRHHHNPRHFDFTVGTQDSGFYCVTYHIAHVGKTDHRLYGNFTVSQAGANPVNDIKFYILDEFQLIQWFGDVLRTQSSRYAIPRDSVQSITDQVTNGRFDIPLTKDSTLHFVFDNRYSTYTQKSVHINFNEEWNEVASSLDLVTTMPPVDKSLRLEVEKIINNTKTDLKIISPYIDTSFLQEIFAKQSNGVTVRMITRSDAEFKGKDKDTALRYIKQHIRNNRRENDIVHSRVIIRDNEQALISSADITHDSLVGQYNAGITIIETNVIKKLLSYFENVWSASK